MNYEQYFLDSVKKRFREYKTLGDKTFEQLNGEEMQVAPNEASNSIAVMVQHLHGNMLSRWTNFLTEDGEKAWRQRDKEFESHTTGKAEIIRLWEEGWKVFLEALEALTPADLVKTITIRSQPLNVTDAINRQMAHYSYHVGQLVYLGRWIRNTDWKTLSIPKART